MQFLERLFTDARFGLRLLLRAPTFAATLLGVLIVGIGSTTAMFSLVSTLLWKPLPYPHPEQLTMVWARQEQVPLSALSLMDFLDWKAQGTTFETMAATEGSGYSLSSPGENPESILGVAVSGDFFPMMGVAPARGRFIGPDDDKPNGPKVAVVSMGLWRRRFGSDPGLVGRAVTLDGEPHTIVGIAPEGFRFAGPYLDHADIWTPLAVSDSRYVEYSTQHRDSHFLMVMGRRKPGVTLEAAQSQLAAIAKTIEEAHPDTNAHVGVRLQDLQEALVRNTRDSLWLLFGAVVLVFLVVCANVANLLLARAAARRPEMAARVALGATRGRLVAQMLTETVSIFVLAAMGGTALARWLVGYVADGFIARGGISTIDLHVDALALGFALAVALVCGVAFGLVPAIEAQRVEPQAVLKEAGTRASLGRSARFFRGGLVVAQVALAFALLSVGGLSLRSYVATVSKPLGLDPTNLVTARVGLSSKKYGDSGKMDAFWRDLLARVAQEPGVSSVAANDGLPYTLANSNGGFEIEGRPPWPEGTGPLVEWNKVVPGYFRTMGMTLRGRDFTAADVPGARRVVIVNQAVADHFFPGEDPIGRRLNLSDGHDGRGDPYREIVGIAGDVCRHEYGKDRLDEVFVPLAQNGTMWITVIARSARPEALLKALPGIVASLDPEQAVFDGKLMQQRIDDAIGPQRFTVRLIGAFAVIALLLATLGIFGVVSYTTTQRTRELGIRVALGSPPAGVVKLVMRDGVRLLGLGLAVGVVVALFLGRGAASRLSVAASFDGPVFAIVLLAISLAGVVASLLPAIRAVRIAPSIALRYE